MNWGEMHEAVKDAKRTMKTYKAFIRSIAELLPNKLQSGNVGHHTLCGLKRELSRYNMKTARWKDS